MTSRRIPLSEVLPGDFVEHPARLSGEVLRNKVSRDGKWRRLTVDASDGPVPVVETWPWLPARVIVTLHHRHRRYA